MPAPPPWRFRCYVSAAGIDQIRTWYEAPQSRPIRGKFLARLDSLGRLPFAEWHPPLFRWLEGGIGEIRFKAAGVQQRPLGFCGLGEDVFTIVFNATERGGRFVPRDAIERAIQRKNELEADAYRSIPCWLFRDS